MHGVILHGTLAMALDPSATSTLTAAVAVVGQTRIDDEEFIGQARFLREPLQETAVDSGFAEPGLELTRETLATERESLRSTSIPTLVGSSHSENESISGRGRCQGEEERAWLVCWIIEWSVGV